ncbi:MAG: CbbX protein, partial [bacterium]
GKLMLKEQQYKFSAEAETAFRSYLTRRMRQPNFANARSVRNALDRARLRQARRLFHDSSGAVGVDQLMTIDASDLLGSRVFQSEKHEEPVLVHSLR